MRQKVILSTYSKIISIVCLILLIACAYACRNNSGGLYALVAIIAGWLLLTLFYTPVAIEVDGDRLRIIRPLRTKDIALSRIVSAKLCSPTMSERRVCGSGGFFGYWGHFSEPSIGRYFAYYGKASDCFLVELTDGRKYILGCEHPDAIVQQIDRRHA